MTAASAIAATNNKKALSGSGRASSPVRGKSSTAGASAVGVGKILPPPLRYGVLTAGAARESTGAGVGSGAFMLRRSLK